MIDPRPDRMACALAIALGLYLAMAAAGQERDPGQDRGDRIGLADLAAYRAALSGRPTADEARPSDPPTRATFRDLWDRPEAYRGRRVTVVGRLERTFRQEAVGSFPPLVEAWVFSATGDPLCVVYPRPERPGGESASEAGAPGPGRLVEFTGTFLKRVRYPARDGDRLAPLIVGDRPLMPPSRAEARRGPGPDASGAGSILRAIGGGDAPRRGGRSQVWVPGLTAALAAALMAALILARHHLRASRAADVAAARRRRGEPTTPDLPLVFVDPPANDAGARQPTSDGGSEPLPIP